MSKSILKAKYTKSQNHFTCIEDKVATEKWATVEAIFGARKVCNNDFVTFRICLCGQIKVKEWPQSRNGWVEASVLMI